METIIEFAGNGLEQYMIFNLFAFPVRRRLGNSSDEGAAADEGQSSEAARQLQFVPPVFQMYGEYNIIQIKDWMDIPAMAQGLFSRTLLDWKTSMDTKMTAYGAPVGVLGLVITRMTWLNERDDDDDDDKGRALSHKDWALENRVTLEDLKS